MARVSRRVSYLMTVVWESPGALLVGGDLDTATRSLSHPRTPAGVSAPRPRSRTESRLPSMQRKLLFGLSDSGRKANVKATGVVLLSLAV